MGNMGMGYGNTSTWTDGNQYIWISSNSDYYYTIKESKEKKKKEFIEENEFKI